MRSTSYQRIITSNIHFIKHFEVVRFMDVPKTLNVFCNVSGRPLHYRAFGDGWL